MTVASPNTSLSLMEQLRDPHAANAWERLVNVYTSLLHAWFHAAGLQTADRDDMTQRVLEVLLRRLPNFVHNGRTGAFRAWLRGIALNVLHEFRRRKRGASSGSALYQQPDPVGALSLLWEQQHDQHVLYSLLRLVEPEFPPPTWQAFRRLALEGAAARDVAKELGKSVNAVLIAKSKVLNRLRREATGILDVAD